LLSWLCLQVKWFSPFLLAVYDADTETFQSLCRCMSGFTDEFYAAATARLGATAIPGPKPYYDTHERPDVWFEPTEVRCMHLLPNLLLSQHN
jgi:DNA ligase-1